MRRAGVSAPYQTIAKGTAEGIPMADYCVRSRDADDRLVGERAEVVVGEGRFVPKL